MSDIKQIKERLSSIERKVSKREYDLKSLKAELENVKNQIYKAVEGANTQDREELDNLLMFINFIKTKFGTSGFKTINYFFFYLNN